jgi:hypothetical protein
MSNSFCSQQSVCLLATDAQKHTDDLLFFWDRGACIQLFLQHEDVFATLQYEGSGSALIELLRGCHPWLVRAPSKISQHHGFAITVLSAGAEAVMSGDFGTPHRDARLGHKRCIST